MSVRGASPLHNNDKPLPTPTSNSTSRAASYSRGGSASPSPSNGNGNMGVDSRNSLGGSGISTTNSASNRFRSSVDNAARSQYASHALGGAGVGHQSLQPGAVGGMASLGLGQSPASGLHNNSNSGNRPASTSKRPSSEMLASFAAGATNAESDALDKWFEDLHHYEATLEEMAAASLDQSFKEELGAIEQWFRVLSEAERTAALYSLLQTSSQVQIRFFITVLQQMARVDPMSALLSPANPQQASMEAQMDAKLASLGLKSPASPAMRQFARQSLGAMPMGSMGEAAGFLSPSSAMLQPPPRSSSSTTPPNNNNAQNSPSSSGHDSADAATLLAAQRARLNAHAANRISAPGSLLSAYETTGGINNTGGAGSLRSPLWSAANTEQVAERSGRSPSPDGRASNAGRSSSSRPASMISDHGLPPNHNNASSAGNLANNLSPNLGSSTNNRHSSGSTFDNIAQALQQQQNNNANNNITMTALEGGALSPLLQGQSWAAMMNTPLMSSFGPNNGGPNADGTFPRLDMSQNNNSNNAWANSQAAISQAQAQAQAQAAIVLDDAKKFRRTGRVSDSGGLPGSIPPMNMNNNNNNMNNMAGNAAAVAAQQNWRNMNAPNNGNNNNGGGMGSPDLSNLATLQAAMQQMNAAAAGNNGGGAGGGVNGMQSPQMAMANLLAAQQQIQQQMQIQQLMAGMNGMNGMGMMGNMQQQQQMLSPVLGGMGLGMMPQAANSATHRRSPRPSDRATMGGPSYKSNVSSSNNNNANNANNPSSTGSGTNPDEPIDLVLLSDTPSWLRSLRLHKYTSNFENSNWKEMILMTNTDLENMGVAALGARRKLLKVFENVRNYQGIPHPPGSEIPGEDSKPE